MIKDFSKFVSIVFVKTCFLVGVYACMCLSMYDIVSAKTLPELDFEQIMDEKMLKLRAL